MQYVCYQCVVFYEAVPQAPIHFLVISRKFYRMLSEVPDEEEQVKLISYLMTNMNEKEISNQPLNCY